MKQKPWCDQVKVKKLKVSRTTLKAHWVDITDATTNNGGYDWHIRDLKCSNCGNWIKAYHGPSYCNNCGSKMQKG